MKNLLKIISLYLLTVSCVETLYCDENGEPELKSGTRASSEQRIFQLKGGAFFRGKRNSMIPESHCLALNAKNEIITINDNPVLIEWKGNKTPKIININHSPFSQEFAEQYAYLGLGHSDQAGLGLRFTIKIGDFNEEFLLKNEELPIKKIIKVNEKHYVIYIRFEKIQDEWEIISNRKFSFKSQGDGYLIRIEYIEFVPEEELGDFTKILHSLIFNEIKILKNNIEEKLKKIALEFRKIEELQNFKDSFIIKKRIEKIYEEIQKEIRLVNLNSAQIEDSQEKFEMISNIENCEKEAFEYLKKAKTVTGSHEKKSLEELKHQEKLIESNLAQAKDLLEAFELSFNNNTKDIEWYYDSIAKIYEESTKIFLISESINKEIQHNLEARIIFENIRSNALKLYKYYEKAYEIVQKIFKLKEEEYLKEEARVISELIIRRDIIKSILQKAIKGIQDLEKTEKTFKYSERSIEKVNELFKNIKKRHKELNDIFIEVESILDKAPFTENINKIVKEIHSYAITFDKWFGKIEKIANKLESKIWKAKTQEGFSSINSKKRRSHTKKHEQKKESKSKQNSKEIKKSKENTKKNKKSLSKNHKSKKTKKGDKSLKNHKKKGKVSSKHKKLKKNRKISLNKHRRE